MKRRILVAVLVSSALLIGLMGAGTAAASKKKGTEGCTPGYWKVLVHTDSWAATGYSPNQLFSTVFEDAFPDMSLRDVLAQGGGGLKALGRHTVAALLNAAHPDVDYYGGYTVASVINMFNEQFPGGDYSTLKDMFEVENERGCPLN